MVEIVKKNIARKDRNNNNTTTGNTSTTSGGNTVIIQQGSNIEVIDNLYSTSSTAALSANQGRLLNLDKTSRNINETINSNWEFTNNLDVNKLNVESTIKTTDNDLNNEIGTSLQKDANNEWLLTTDNIKVRKRLNVETLEIQHARHIGGKLYCTKAGCVINKIGEDDNIYRCYFKDKDADGNQIYNEFQEGDLVFCQTFNNNKSHIYWRYCTGARDNYVDLSKKDLLLGSDKPMIGDTIVQLGNKKDKTRQGAVIIEPLKINIYNNITTYLLPLPIITLNPTNSRIDADTINFLGKTIINNNFIVDNNGNLTVKGTINADKGYFRGFILKGTTVITKDNIKQFLTEEDWNGDGTFIQYTWNFNKMSNIMYFRGNFTEDIFGTAEFPMGYLPSIYPASLMQELNITYSQHNLEEVRSYINTEIIMYNESDFLFSFSGAMSDTVHPKGFVSHALLPHKAMKLKCMQEWINGEETIYWLYEDHDTFAKGN